MEALKAAVKNGANAVYLGGKLFNARHYASNFTFEELEEAISYAHFYGVRVYITVNILIDNSEMEEAVEYIRYLYNKDVDGVIVQDIGLAKLIRDNFPDMEIHGSTQMTIYNLEGARLLEEMGFTRVVLARETPISEIARIKRESKIELEVFVHGALCMSYSGQCLLSSVIGGRSGNRGTCAQPCRLEYKALDKRGNILNKLEDKYLLSPRDLNTIYNIEDLIEIPVDSLKIEGRMKRPEYVANIVKTYREAIDQGSKEIDKLRSQEVRQLFNRGFTRGLGLGDFGRDYMSLDRPDNRGLEIGEILDINKNNLKVKLLDKLNRGDTIEVRQKNGSFRSFQSPFEGEKNTIIVMENIRDVDPKFNIRRLNSISLLEKYKESYQFDQDRDISMEASIKIGESPILKITCDDLEIEEIGGAKVEEAKTQGLDREKIVKQVSKLGNTRYSLKNIEVDLDENAFIPVRELNELRRCAIEKLDRIICNFNNRPEKKPEEVSISLPTRGKSREQAESRLNIRVSNLRQLFQVDLKKLHRLYLDHNINLDIAFEKIRDEDVDVYLWTDNILDSKDMGEIGGILEKYQEKLKGISISNLGLLKLIKKDHNLKIHGDTALNIFNNWTIEALRDMGLESFSLSQELNLGQIKNLNENTISRLESVVYGRIKVMTTRNCPFSPMKNCKDDRECGSCQLARKVYLEDRKGQLLAVERINSVSKIYDSKILFLLEDLEEIGKSKVKDYRLDFTVEEDNIGEIQDLYYKSLRGIKLSKKDGEFLDSLKKDNKLSKGHYYKGLL